MKSSDGLTWNYPFIFLSLLVQIFLNLNNGRMYAYEISDHSQNPSKAIHDELATICRDNALSYSNCQKVGELI